MPELVINVSNIISPLCYSIIRVEPYTTCSFRCTYCYARWYRSEGVIRARSKAIGEFAAIARKIYRKGLKPIPARLSTLVDPFQYHEELFKASLKILEIALEYEYPLIINTKGVLYGRDPWRKLLEELADKGLTILQISISTLNEDVSRKLEPIAPSPRSRLEIAKEFAYRGIPFVLRISPFIPRISTYPDVETFTEVLHEYGVKHVIVEALRLESAVIHSLLRSLGLMDVDVESYSLREVEGLKPVSRIGLYTRLKEYTLLARHLARHGITFATCKEGLFQLHSASDCCGIYLFKHDVALRLTLYEVYRYLIKSTSIDVNDVDKVLKHICNDRYLDRDRLREYPKRIVRPLIYHEKKLVKVLRSRDLLKHVTPNLDIVDGKLIAIDLRDLSVSR